MRSSRGLLREVGCGCGRILFARAEQNDDARRNFAHHAAVDRHPRAANALNDEAQGFGLSLRPRRRLRDDARSERVRDRFARAAPAGSAGRSGCCVRRRSRAG